jgi:hypothetical protein
MNTHVIIVADMGRLKAFRINEKSLVRRHKAEVIKKIEYEAAHKKLSDIVTDREGRFRGSGNARSSHRATGEEHNLKSDLAKKAIKHLAKDIENIIQSTTANSYYLALPKPIIKQTLDEIGSGAKKKITHHIAADLSKEPMDKVRGRFNV